MKKILYTILALGLLFLILSFCVYNIPQLTAYDLIILKKIQKIFTFISPENAYSISEFLYQNLWQYCLIIFASFFILKNYDFLTEIIFLFLIKYGCTLKDLIKNIIARHRPPAEVQPLVHYDNYSFPSGHSFFSMLFLGLLAYFAHKYIKNKYLKLFTEIICFLGIIFVGFSRLILGVHYPTDVLGGFILGLIVVLCSIMLDKIFSKESYINSLKNLPLLNKFLR